MNNPLADILKDAEREKYYSKVVNTRCSYDTVYRQTSINHDHILFKNLRADIPKDMERKQNTV